MMKKFMAGLAALVAAAAPAAAWAGCAEFQTVGSELVGSYDPFSPAPVERLFNLRVTRIDPTATAVRFILVDTTAQGAEPRLGRDGPRRYDVEWNRDSSRRVFFTGVEQPGPTNGALVGFGPGASGGAVTEGFRLRLPAGQQAFAGRHYQDLEIRYVCSYGDDVGAVDFQTGNRVAIDLEVAEVLTTYIGSRGTRRGEIALGTLDPAGGMITGEVAITTQSTVPYNIHFARRRSGLRRSDQDTAVIPYAMRFGSNVVAPGSRVSCGPTTGGPSGQNYPFRVLLDQSRARGMPAGEYSDTITLTFTPGTDLAGGWCDGGGVQPL